MRRGFCSLALAGIVAVAPSLAAGQAATGRTYQARLSAVPIDLAMAATIAGSGNLTATLKGRTLTIVGTFKGIKSPATVARLHRGPNRGLRGAPVADLTVTASTSGDLTGSVELTTGQVADLEKGRLYVQLHSAGAPEGNLWGWLLSGVH